MNYSELREAKKKIQTLKGHLEKAMEQIKEICFIYSDAISCRSPTRNYALFLLERYLLLKFKAMWLGKPYEFNNFLDFVTSFDKKDDHTRYFLCELYMHNLFLKEKVDENHVPFIGDVQFQAFISFSLNQIKWVKAYHTFQRRELFLDLSVRGEPHSLICTLVCHKRLIRKSSVFSTLEPIHNEVVESGLEYLGDIRVEALRGAKQRWQA